MISYVVVMKQLVSLIMVTKETREDIFTVIVAMVDKRKITSSKT